MRKQRRKNLQSWRQKKYLRLKSQMRMIVPDLLAARPLIPGLLYRAVMI